MARHSIYLGDEPNAARRDWDLAAVRWLMCASWDYSQASGNMSIPAVYDAIHKAGPQYLCDRWYLPATPRDLGLLEKAGIPTFGIESKRQAREFDIVGTSISYSVLFMNFCKELSLAGIPLRREHREQAAGDYPLVIIGGQAACSPEFMAAVADCFWLGEVEDEPGNPGISDVLQRIESFKETGRWGRDRDACYRELAAEFRFLYFPRYTTVTYEYQDRGLPEPSKQVAAITSEDGIGPVFRARRVRDLDQASLLTSTPLIYSDPKMGGGDLEVGRGCPAWCSFCRLSWVTKPYRQETVPRSVERAAQWRRNMGSAELSPFAPDFPMHTAKKELLGRLMEEVSADVDTSSFRIDDYLADDQYVYLHALGGADSLTLGLEGNSQRIRDLSGKGTSDADVEAAVTKGIRAGIRKFKLYMISNWPGEEPADVDRIVALGKRLAAIRDSFGDAAKGVVIQFSWTPVLLEAQTPLQWFAVTAPDYTLQDSLHQLKNAGISVKIGTKAAPEKLAFFQACQRASRAAGDAIADVIEHYGTASWGGFPRDMKDRLDTALIARGFRNGLEDLFGERHEHDLLGWEHISTGVSKKLMWRTYQGMVSFLEGTSGGTYDSELDENYHGAEFVPRCDQHCSGATCGACDREDLELRRAYITASAAERNLDARPVRRLDQASIAARVRLRLDIGPAHRYVSADHWRFALRRAAYRAAVAVPGFPAVATCVRLASEALKYRDWVCGTDYAEIGLTRPVTDPADLDAFIAAMAAELAPWASIAAWAPGPAGAVMPSRAPSLQELDVTGSPDAVAAAVARWDKADTVPCKVRAESFYAGTVLEDTNAKDHVRDLWLARTGTAFTLKTVLAGRLGPYQVYAALMGKPSWIEAARTPARRLDFFTTADLSQGDLLRPACAGCGWAVPENLLGRPWDPDYCPRCADEAGRHGTAVLAGLARAGV